MNQNQTLSLATAIALLFTASASLANSTLLSTVEVSEREQLLAGGISPDELYSLPESFANSVQTFTREDIKNMPVRNAYEVLDMAAGVFLQTQGRKAPNMLSMRAGSNLGIILDGALIPSPSAPKILASLPLSAIEQIDVVRDSSALNLGPLSAPIGAMTDNRTEGFVVITTRSALNKKNDITASTDDRQLAQVGISHAMTLGKGSGVRATLNHEQRNEFEGNNKGYDRNAGYFRGSHTAKSYWFDVNLFRGSGRTDLQRSTPGTSMVNDKWSYDPADLSMIAIQGGKQWSAWQTTSIRASHTSSDAQLDKYSWVNPKAYGVENTRENFTSLDVNHAMRLGDHRLRVGFNWLEWKNPSGMLHWYGIPVAEHTRSFYIQDELKVGSWSFDAGARVDNRDLDQSWEQIGNLKRPFSDKALDPLYAASMGAAYLSQDKHRFSGRMLYTQQAPIGVMTQNNQALPVESRLRYELGWSKSWMPALATKVTAYVDQLTDAAYVSGQVNDPLNPTQKLNVYSASSRDNKGLELMLDGRSQHWFYQLAYSMVEPGKTPVAVVNVPTNLVKARLGWRDGAWSADLHSRYMDKYQSANFAGVGYSGDFVSTDVRVARDFKQDADLTHTLGLFVRNIADNRYTTVYGFPDEGRVIGLDYRLAY